MHVCESVRVDRHTETETHTDNVNILTRETHRETQRDTHAEDTDTHRDTQRHTPYPNQQELLQPPSQGTSGRSIKITSEIEKKEKCTH